MTGSREDGLVMNRDLRGLLVFRLREEGMPTDVPISVAELHRRLLPYPLCRERLGYASKAEYDIGLLRLLSDDRSMEVPEQALVEAVRRELRAPEPGLALLQRFAASEVRVKAPRESGSGNGDGEGVALETGPPIASLETGRSRGDYVKGLDDPFFVPIDEAADALGLGTRGKDAEPEEAVTEAPGTPSARGSGPAMARSGLPCRSCAENLPAREGLRFCPKCGADQERWPCPACGKEVERGWKYCALCGKLLRT